MLFNLPQWTFFKMLSFLLIIFYELFYRFFFTCIEIRFHDLHLLHILFTHPITQFCTRLNFISRLIRLRHHPNAECRCSSFGYTICNVRRRIRRRKRSSCGNDAVQRCFDGWVAPILVTWRLHRDCSKRLQWIPRTHWMKSPFRFQGLMNVLVAFSVNSS